MKEKITRAFIVPLVLVGFVTVLKTYVPIIGKDAPFFLFPAVIIISSYFGGLWAGFFAIFASLFVTANYFVEPIGYSLYTNTKAIQLFAFIFQGILFVGFVTLVHYQTEKIRKRENALMQKEEHLRLMVEGAREYAMILLTPGGHIQEWNSGAKRLIGYEPEEVLGKHFGVFYITSDRKKRLPQKELQEAKRRGSVRSEKWIQKKDGSSFWANSITTPVFTKKGKAHGYVKIIRDLTEEKQKNERKDEFIGIVSHELRTPITSIKAFVQLLQKRLTQKSDTQTLPYIEKINDQVNRMVMLLKDLLDMSRIQTGKLVLHKEGFILEDLIQEVIQDLTPTTAHTFRLKIYTKNHFVKADRERISEVLINLLNNAVKYSPEDKPVEISLRDEKTRVVVLVRDYGTGINRKEQKKIFERFYTTSQTNTKDQGLGLGLYIAREIIRLHKGRLFVESEPHTGSIFSFSIPLFYASSQGRKRSN